MTVADWIAESRREIRKNGWEGAKDSAYKFYVGTFRNVGKRWNYGTPIYEHEWDLLIVLDACRTDLLAEVVDEYSFLSDEVTYSVASSSKEWMEKNFTNDYNDEIANTAYVTSNPYSSRVLTPDQFYLLDEVWKYVWDKEVRTIPADGVTERAIQVHRNEQPPRMLVHYMQPHHPFVPNPLDQGIPRNEFSSTPWDSVWHKLRKGELTIEEVWEGYRANLRYVLDSVEVLLENCDAETAVITSDHANLIGEYGLYAHPDYVPIKNLKRVPWCVTTAVDKETYEPKERLRDETAVSVEEQLRHLGYTE